MLSWVVLGPCRRCPWPSWGCDVTDVQLIIINMTKVYYQIISKTNWILDSIDYYQYDKGLSPHYQIIISKTNTCRFLIPTLAGCVAGYLVSPYYLMLLDQHALYSRHATCCPCDTMHLGSDCHDPPWYKHPTLLIYFITCLDAAAWHMLDNETLLPYSLSVTIPLSFRSKVVVYKSSTC